MKLLLSIILLASITFAKDETAKPYIDMHGGKNKSLLLKKGNKFSNDNIGMSSILNSKKSKDTKNINNNEKVEINK